MATRSNRISEVTQTTRFRLALLLLLAPLASFDTQIDPPPQLPAVHPDDAVRAFMTATTDSVFAILNGNLWMLPGVLAVDKRQRLDRFIALARTLRPQVITLQEVWTMDLVAALARRLPAFEVFTSGGRGAFNDGVLVTLTRVPGSAPAFTPFDLPDAASRIEKAARKGYLSVRVTTPALDVRVVNTHLYAPTSRRDTPLVAAQFRALKKLDVEAPFIVVGDLNLDRRAFNTLNGAFFVSDADTAATYDPANRYTHHGANALHRRVRRKKIDRLLLPRAYARTITMASMLLREPVVSDHYLLAYRLTLRAAEPTEAAIATR